MSINKVRIDAPAGVVEVEGEKEFVEEQVDKILPLIQSSGFGSQAANPATAPQPANMESGEFAAAPQNKDGPAKPKRKIAQPPKGHSCRDRIKALKADGFFKELRTPSEIVVGLGKKGWTYKNNQVGAALTNMFEKGELQRTKDGSGFKYYWDRD